MYTKKASRDNVNLLFQNEYNFTNNLISNIGIRYDRFSDFGNTLNPKLSLMYNISDFKFRSSYGTSFKAPSFTNMYSHFTRSAGPITYEFAVGYNKNSFDFEIIYHNSKLKNLINSYTVSYDPITRINYTSYKNINRASIEGLELSSRYNLSNSLNIGLGWEYLNTKDKTSGERLTGSAKDTIKLNVIYTYNKLDAFFNLKRYQKYYASNESRVNTNSNYTVADLKLNYKFTKKLDLFLGIDNIFNKKMPYNMTSKGTPNDPGQRYYYTGIEYTF